MLFTKDYQNEVCEGCLVKSTCSEICQKVYTWYLKEWNQLQKNGKCIFCDHNKGELYKFQHEDCFLIKCDKCSTGIIFSYGDYIPFTEPIAMDKAPDVLHYKTNRKPLLKGRFVYIINYLESYFKFKGGHNEET